LGIAAWKYLMKQYHFTVTVPAKDTNEALWVMDCFRSDFPYIEFQLVPQDESDE
jgi:hypothetical protein